MEGRGAPRVALEGLRGTLGGSHRDHGQVGAGGAVTGPAVALGWQEDLGWTLGALGDPWGGVGLLVVLVFLFDKHGTGMWARSRTLKYRWCRKVVWLDSGASLMCIFQCT